jgi:hypothetical protein
MMDIKACFITGDIEDEFLQTMAKEVQKELDNQMLATIYHTQIPDQLIFQFRLKGYTYAGIMDIDLATPIDWKEYYPEEQIGVLDHSYYYIRVHQNGC